MPSWTAFGTEDPLDERAVNQMLVGVTTRRYARSLEPLAEPLPERGTSKSAVSRRFVAATQKQMDAWLGRDHSRLKLVALMIDGIVIAEHAVLVVIDGGKALAKAVRNVYGACNEFCA